MSELPNNRFDFEKEKYPIDPDAVKFALKFKEMQVVDTARVREMRKQLGLDKETEKLIQEINGLT